MGDEVSIDKASFHTRLSSLITQWKADKRSGNNVFGDVGSIVVVMGKSDEAQSFHKTNATQFWLLGYEFPATLFLFTLEAMYIVTTKKKAAYLDVLKDGKIPIEIIVRGKDAEENAKQFERCLDIIKNAGKKVGVLTKDASTGPFVQEWKTAFGDISKDVEEVDIGPALSQAMAVKDENELRAISNASRASANVMQDYFIDAMSNILDDGKKITHKALSDRVEGKLDDDKFFRAMKLPANFDALQLDWSFRPIVMSGGNFDLKMGAEPDENNLHAGVIVSSLGMRYQNYAAAVARTYLVDPTKAQENMYKLLLNVHETVIKEMRDGVVAKDVYAKALNLVKAKKPELEKNFVKNVGAGIGIELRDSSLVLNAKDTRTLRDGMTFTVTTGFSDLENKEATDKKRDGTYALLLTDTVRITSGNDAYVFTKHAATDTETTLFFFNDDEEEEKKEKPKAKRDNRTAIASSNELKTRTRGQGQATVNEEKENARRDHQRQLRAKKHRDGLDKYREGHGNLNGTEVKKFKRFESYKQHNQFPSRTRDLMVVADPKTNSILVPIMGRPVPFHINTLKNATTSTEGDFCYLRINFLSPGQGVGRKDDQPFEDPAAQFIRSLTFRSRDVDRMEGIKDSITEMKKAAVRKEQEKKDMEDVVEQDKLIEIRNRRPIRLENVFMRPAMESKRISGAVEIHQNGLRYHHLGGGQKVDLLFSNVKHLFFQPCVGELIVIIHVHLKDPIIIGKKKTKDVQFYREATDMQFDDTGNRKRKHRYGDEEEFEAEQEEKRRRAQLDKEFRNFSEKIADAGKGDGLSVDMPFRDLGFNGVPARSSVTIIPTTDCLVQLVEPPFLVITLTEIEVVHLERVQFGLKNFDMAVVYNDFTRQPTHINTIPVESLDSVKDWLDSVDIPFTEGPLNLNWPTIMKTIIYDPHLFFAEGGWDFLNTQSDSEDEEEEEEESAFEVSDAELASGESSEDESEFDDDASAEASEEEVSEEDEGEDWDEMETKLKSKKERAEEADEKKVKKGKK
ncbi:FACT complex protein [Neohortaea acidophila]|uniref:FACT complex subunit n=1 Tax=Neohortaea acidophila TaxID=245834 RepID=A0A6A6Q0U2_9PEZI|nr:FACT complex protein [Neohortaea acidophila]KAF2485902.1 FACT complex protein [Neohortaea acidophila]